jgi:hypothetical protein
LLANLIEWVQAAAAEILEEGTHAQNHPGEECKGALWSKWENELRKHGRIENTD